MWEYVYNGSQLTQMKKGSDTLHFTYDAAGTPTTVTHKTATGETTYYYVTNLQGDVVKIIDSTGTTVATYTYDAWGNILLWYPVLSLPLEDRGRFSVLTGIRYDCSG